MFYLWQHWKKYHYSSNGDDNFCKNDSGDPVDHAHGSQEESLNSPRHTGVPMEVDRVFLADPHDSKQLRGSILASSTLTLETEHMFINSILDSCCNTEQRSFALAYKKWLDIVIHVQS